MRDIGLVLMLAAAVVSRKDWPSIVLFVVGALMYLALLLR